MFEFDPHKSAANKKKHGMGFEEAKAMWSESMRRVFQLDCTTEKRYGITAVVGKKVYTGIYTMRNGRIRIISVRSARTEKRQAYHAEK
jgi:uncharacterized DUF497 family protein